MTNAPQPGDVVHYYAEGWRYGYLHSVKNDTVTILPIVSRYASPPRKLKVRRDDVEEFRNLPVQPVQTAASAIEEAFAGLAKIKPKPVKKPKKKVKKCVSASAAKPVTTTPTPARTTKPTSAARPAKSQPQLKSTAAKPKPVRRTGRKVSSTSAKPVKRSKPTRKGKKK